MAAAGRDDARKVIDAMLKPARGQPVLVGDGGLNTVMKEAVCSIPSDPNTSLSCLFDCIIWFIFDLLSTAKKESKGRQGSYLCFSSRT